MGHYEVL